MNKIHIALSTNDIDSSVIDYTKRMGEPPCVVVENEYALWRTETVNLSIRCDNSVAPGMLRHLGWEEDDVESFTSDSDCNGILWESFTADQQAEEINQFWPDADYKAKA